MATSDGAKVAGCSIALVRAFIINPLWCTVIGMTLYELEATVALWVLCGIYITVCLVTGFCSFAFAIATCDD